MLTRSVFTALLALSSVTAAQVPARAQDWPSRPVHVMIPWGAGSAIDVVVRSVFEQVGSAQPGRVVVIENRPGAAGTIGTASVVRAEADGYTLLANSNAHFLTEFTFPSLPYSPTKDLVGVSGLAAMANILVVRPDRFKTMQEFIAAAKAKPNALTYGSIGVGATSHLNVKRLELSAGFEAVHVAFRAQPDVLSEILGGRLDFAFAPAAAALPLVKDGQLRALAVSTPKRMAALPDLQTSTEAGYPDSDYQLWQGIFVSSKTPAPLVRQISQEINKALGTKIVRDRFAAIGVEAMDTPTPEAFDALIQKEVALNAVLAKAAGLGAAKK